MRQSLSGYGGVSIPLVKMFAEQKVDASFGLAFLVAGFVVQGAAGYGYKSTSTAVIEAGIALGAIGLIAYFSLRSHAHATFVQARMQNVREESGLLQVVGAGNR